MSTQRNVKINFRIFAESLEARKATKVLHKFDKIKLISVALTQRQLTANEKLRRDSPVSK